MDDKKTPKNPKNFYCVTCDFRSSIKKDYNRHLSTAKHLRMTQCLQIDDKKPHCNLHLNVGNHINIDKAYIVIN